MAQEYAISETTLTALGDAVRKHVGATKLVQTGIEEQEIVKISKTSNALSFTERSGGYGIYQSVYDVVSIPGASKIVVDIAYQTEGTSYDWVQIAVGSVSSAPSTSYPKYGGRTLTRKELTFEDTDTITFYFKSDSSTDGYLGYYAECRGYDEEGNVITNLLPVYEEVPNTMTVNTMIEKINGFFPCEFWWHFNTGAIRSYSAGLDVSNYSTLTFVYDIATSDISSAISTWTLQAYKGYKMGVSPTNNNVAQPNKVDSNGIVEDILSNYRKTENGIIVSIDVSDYNYITFLASNKAINSTAYYGFLHLYNFSAE